MRYSVLHGDGKHAYTRKQSKQTKVREEADKANDKKSDALKMPAPDWHPELPGRTIKYKGEYMLRPQDKVLTAEEKEAILQFNQGRERENKSIMSIGTPTRAKRSRIR